MKHLQDHGIKMSLKDSDKLWRNWWKENAKVARSDVEQSKIKVDVDNYWPCWDDLVIEDVSKWTPSYTKPN